MKNIGSIVAITVGILTVSGTIFGFALTFGESKKDISHNKESIKDAKEVIKEKSNELKKEIKEKEIDIKINEKKIQDIEKWKERQQVQEQVQQQINVQQMQIFDYYGKQLEKIEKKVEK